MRTTHAVARRAAGAALVFAAALAAAAAAPTPAQAADMMAAIEAQPDLKTFAQIARRSGADRELSSRQGIMVLAPVDSAFNQFGGQLERTLAADPAAARRFVLAHTVSQVFQFGASEPGTLGQFPTLDGGSMELRSAGSQPGYANEQSRPVAINIRADNGLLHKMDSVVAGGPAGVRNLPANPNARPQNPGGVSN